MQIRVCNRRGEETRFNAQRDNTCTKPPRPVLTDVGYLPERSKEINGRVVNSDVPYYNVFVGVM